MKKKRAETPVMVGEITIIPLTELSINQFYNKGSFSIYASYVPIGIAVDSPQGKRAIDIQGRDAPLETYLQEIPELKDILFKNESL